MREGRQAGGNGNSDFGHSHQIDLRPDLPFSTDKVQGVDLTHIIHTSDISPAAARGGSGGGGGGSGGGGTTTFAPYVSGSANGALGFDIKIEFKGTWTQDYYNIFVAAADQLTALIIGDLQDVSVRTKGGVVQVDDILITAELGTIDGLNGILGQAGPTAVRTDNSLPATAQMKFDIADVNAMSLQAFADVVLHEMSHSLGFGSIWSRLGLVTNGQYTGQYANAEYQQMGGAGFIPVEQDGGSGTAGSHWDEETFGNELLTGYLNSGTNYFTEMSAASFQDLGYQISPNYGPIIDQGYIFA